MKKYFKNKIKKYFMFLKVFKQNCKFCEFKINSFGICSKCFNLFKYFIYPNYIYINGMKIMSLSRYVSDIKEEILNFKLRNKREISKFFILSIFYYPKLISDITTYEYITYVPMDKEKEKIKRGYNQAKIIAKDLSMFLGIEVINLIEKVKKNKIQSSVRKEYRQENVKDVYEVKEGFDFIDFKKVLVVDDIFTTGATLFEIRRKIKDKYPNAKVDAFVLSKTISIKKEETSLVNRKYKYLKLKERRKLIRKRILEEKYK